MCVAMTFWSPSLLCASLGVHCIYLFFDVRIISCQKKPQGKHLQNQIELLFILIVFHLQTKSRTGYCRTCTFIQCNPYFYHAPLFMYHIFCHPWLINSLCPWYPGECVYRSQLASRHLEKMSTHAACLAMLCIKILLNATKGKTQREAVRRWPEM